MAMYLAGTPIFLIMLVGRWSSTEFLKYIQKQVQEFSHGISSKMIEIQSFRHVQNSTATNPMENIVGDLYFAADGINWWREHHCRRTGAGLNQINFLVQTQPVAYFISEGRGGAVRCQPASHNFISWGPALCYFHIFLCAHHVCTL